MALDFESAFRQAGIINAGETGVISALRNAEAAGLPAEQLQQLLSQALASPNESFPLLAQKINEAGQLEQLRTKFQTEIFGSPTATLEQALESTAQGELGQLSRALLQQQQTSFQTQLPFLQQTLQRQGIFDSGAAFALPAAQQGQLELQRQQALLSAGLGASESLRNLQLGARTSGFELDRQAISQNFQSMLMNERMRLMQQLSNYNQPSFLQKFGGVIGAGLGAALAIPTGGLSVAGGAALGGLLGGTGGSFFGPSEYQNPNQFLSLISMLQGQTGGR